MTLGDRIGWFAIILLAVMLAPSWPWAALALVSAVVTLRWGVKRRQRASERQRLIHDCETQHREYLAGGQVIIPGPVWSNEQPTWSKMDS